MFHHGFSDRKSLKMHCLILKLYEDDEDALTRWSEDAWSLRVGDRKTFLEDFTSLVINGCYLSEDES